MKARTTAMVFRSVLFGLAVGIAFSPGRLISVRVWFAASAGLLAVNLLARLLQTARVEATPLAVLWTWRPAWRGRFLDQRPRDLRSIEALLSSSVKNGRASSYRLRPRLRAMADHSSYGMPRDPLERFGELAWLVDPAETERAPTLDEIAQFLDMIETIEVAGTIESVDDAALESRRVHPLSGDV